MVSFGVWMLFNPFVFFSSYEYSVTTSINQHGLTPNSTSSTLILTQGLQTILIYFYTYIKKQAFIHL